MNKKAYIKYFLLTLTFYFFAASFSYYDNPGKGDITADNVIADIKYLASDELGGRFPEQKEIHSQRHME